MDAVTITLIIGVVILSSLLYLWYKRATNKTEVDNMKDMFNSSAGNSYPGTPPPPGSPRTYRKESSTKRTSTDDDEGDFIESVIAGAMANSTVAGAAIGGSVLGAAIGDMLVPDEPDKGQECQNGPEGQDGAYVPPEMAEDIIRQVEEAAPSYTPDDTSSWDDVNDSSWDNISSDSSGDSSSWDND